MDAQQQSTCGCIRKEHERARENTMEGHNRLAPALYGIRTTPKVGLSYVGNVWDCSTFGGLQLSVWRGGRKAVSTSDLHGD